ncbi:hypothetical protein DV735_g1397, partial [Chaetothyriales sp. CBS 134920]
MSRNAGKSGRGRLPKMPVPSMLRSDQVADAPYQEGPKKKPKSQPRRKYAATVQQKKRKRAASTPSETSSSSSDAEDEASEGDDESDADDENSEEPLGAASSVGTLPVQTGHSFPSSFEDFASDADNESMFDSNFQLQNGDINLFSVGGVSGPFATDDDNDDEAYKAVDDISDSDDEDVEAYEEQQLLAMLSDDEIVEGELLNQIDGLSEYGFGNESDSTTHFHSPPESDLEHMPQRHVHFGFDSPEALHRGLSISPTISRALLPSALPEHLGIYPDPPSSSSSDTYDSDATDEDLPPAAIQQAAAAAKDKPATLEPGQQPERSPNATPKAKAKTPQQRRGPPRGIFIDEGTKASGILDSSGKVLLITHPHLLGDEFAKRYGNSAPASPSAGFQELLDGSDAESMGGIFDSVPLLDPNAVGDALLAQISSPAGVQNMMPAGSSFAPDFGSNPFMLDDVFSDDLGEDVIDIADVIKFDESDDSDDPGTPIYMPPKNQLSSVSARNSVPSFVNAGVTAFRNNTDPNFTTFSTEKLSRLAELTTPVRRAHSARKRKRAAADTSEETTVDDLRLLRQHTSEETTVDDLRLLRQHTSEETTVDDLRLLRQHTSEETTVDDLRLLRQHTSEETTVDDLRLLRQHTSEETALIEMVDEI